MKYVSVPNNLSGFTIAVKELVLAKRGSYGCCVNMRRPGKSDPSYFQYVDASIIPDDDSPRIKEELLPDIDEIMANVVEIIDKYQVPEKPVVEKEKAVEPNKTEKPPEAPKKEEEKKNVPDIEWKLNDNGFVDVKYNCKDYCDNDHHCFLCEKALKAFNDIFDGILGDM